jgi:hypothetical protein
MGIRRRSDAVVRGVNACHDALVRPSASTRSK